MAIKIYDSSTISRLMFVNLFLLWIGVIASPIVAISAFLFNKVGKEQAIGQGFAAFFETYLMLVLYLAVYKLWRERRNLESDTKSSQA